MNQPIKIRCLVDVLAITAKWRKRREENFFAITLNCVHDVIRFHHISKGILNKTIVHPRECFYPVIKDYSAAVIFVHNHPSGSAELSPEDDVITDRLCMAGVILGISILDHVIITPHDNYYSYREEGKIKGDYFEYEKECFIEQIAAEKSVC